MMRDGFFSAYITCRIHPGSAARHVYDASGGDPRTTYRRAWSLLRSAVRIGEDAVVLTFVREGSEHATIIGRMGSEGAK